MTKQEVNKLLALMRANYSRAFKGMSQQDRILMLNTWTFTLQDLDANVVMIAAMQLISSSKWLPTVAEIREKCQRLYYESAFANCCFPYDGISTGKTEAMQTIAFRTNHLRGEKSAEISLDALLSNPQFAAMTSGNTHSLLEAMGRELDDSPGKGA